MALKANYEGLVFEIVRGKNEQVPKRAREKCLWACSLTDGGENVCFIGYKMEGFYKKTIRGAGGMTSRNWKRGARKQMEGKQQKWRRKR